MNFTLLEKEIAHWGEKEKPRSDRRTDGEKERENVRGRGRGVLLAKRVLVPQYRTGHVWHRQYQNDHPDSLATQIVFERRCYQRRIFFVNSYGGRDFAVFAANVSLSKMVSTERTVMIIFGLALFVTSGSALRCWVCSSNVNVMCNDPMNTTDHQATFHIKTCDPGPYGSSKPICRKTVKREYGQRVVIRQCSTPYHDEMDIVDGQCGNSMTQPGRDVIESCHICSSDLCNSATGTSAMRLLYVAMIILLACTFHQSKYVL